jgi:serine/threonine protein kinase
MDFAEGGTLADKTPEGKYKYLPMKEDDVIQVVKETVNAFDFCHSRGIVHRDIKPGNLFYKNADGSDILVGDFGISSEVDLEGGMSKRMTTTSRTEGYAAPEIYSGVIGKEIDYYALGITIYELLTGKNPFAGRNDMHIMRDTIQGRVAEDLITRPEANSFSNRTKKLIQGLLTVRHEKRWGLLEVNRFLKGEDVPVAENLIKEIPAFTFGSKKYTDYVELSLALQEDRESAKKMLYRGNITRWAEGFDNDFAIQIGDIVEEYSKPEEQEFGLVQLLFLLNPDRSCTLDNGHTLRTFEELKNKIMLIGESIVKDLQNKKSELYAWLLQNNLKEFIAILSDLKRLNLSDRRFISSIKVALTDGYIQTSENIYLYKISDILSLNENDREIIFKAAIDKDSYFSVWFESKGDREMYNLWWSNKVDRWIYNFDALLKNDLVEYKGVLRTVEDTIRVKEDEIEREFEIVKNKQIQEEREKKELDELVQECRLKLKYYRPLILIPRLIISLLFFCGGEFFLVYYFEKKYGSGSLPSGFIFFGVFISVGLGFYFGNANKELKRLEPLMVRVRNKLREKGYSNEEISKMTRMTMATIDTLDIIYKY